MLRIYLRYDVKSKVAECWQMFVGKHELNVYCKINVIIGSSEMLRFFIDIKQWQKHLTKTTQHEVTILGCDECYLLLKEE